MFLWIKVLWKLSSSGSFSVASAYAATRITNSKVWWSKLLWARYIPPKFSFCCWLLMKQRLKARMLLSRRGMNIDTICPLCFAHDEDCIHLFFGCTFSKQVFESALSHYGIRRQPFPWNQERLWLKRNAKGRNLRAKMIRKIFCCTVDYIWQERNLRIFQNQARSISAVRNIIIQFCSVIS